MSEHKNLNTFHFDGVPDMNGYVIRTYGGPAAPLFVPQLEVYRSGGLAWPRWSELKKVYAVKGPNFMKLRIWKFQLGAPDKLIAEATQYQGKWFYNFEEFIRWRWSESGWTSC